MIEPDIRKAQTLESRFYRDAGIFEAARDRIWAKAWHYAGDAAALATPGYAHPFTLLPGILDEPLVITADQAGSGDVCPMYAPTVARLSLRNQVLSGNFHAATTGVAFVLMARLKACQRLRRL